MSGPSWLEEAPPGRRRPRPRRQGAAPDGGVELVVQTGRVQIILWLVAGALICLNFLVGVTGQLKLLPWTITRFFDSADNDSLLTATKTTVALLSALVMSGCALAARRRGDPTSRGWRWLAWVTGFVFADEATSLHRSVARVVEDHYHFQGPARYTWALMYLPLAAVLLVVLVRDVKGMPAAVRNRLLPGGLLYVTGAVALEPFVARLAQANGDESLSFKVMVAFGDSCALAGLVLVFCAVLVAASRLADGFTFRLTPSGRGRETPAEQPDGRGDPA